MVTETGTPVGTKPFYQMLDVKWGWLMTIGIIMAIAGMAAIIFPAVTSVGIEILLGIVLLVAGVVRILTLFTSHGVGQFFLRLLGVVAFIAAGALLLANPFSGTFTLTLMLGFYFMIQGILGIIISFSSTSEKGWGWVLFNGIVALALGVLIWTGLPSSAAWAIGLLVGIQLVLDGWMLIMVALAEHAEEKHHMSMPLPA